MLKRTIVRLMLFGIPFGLSYWLTKPVAPVAVNQTLMVCAYPGDHPGELRIKLDPAGCSQGNDSRISGAAPVSVHPAVNIPKIVEESTAKKPLSISF